MKKLFLLNLGILFHTYLISAQNQTPIVPSTIRLANLQLIITDEAKETIQRDVNNITQNNKYFLSKAERASCYFPLIEKILKEEEVPDDFKFLALQESSLLANAVSSSNAVGYWQFKEETAKEMGLTIDNTVDDRMHILLSTRAAARYLKKNNILLNNWIYTLLSYNVGLGGVKAIIDPSEMSGVTTIEINKKTHWYITRFLAHKIAFENNIPKETPIKLAVIENKNNQTLNEIAEEWKVDAHDLSYYNAWLKTAEIPSTISSYNVIVPVPFNYQLNTTTSSTASIKVIESQKNEFIIKNGLRAITSKKDDTHYILAMESGVSERKILRYNDIKRYEDIIQGLAYYLEPKHTQGNEDYYTVQEDENLWEISQQLGIKKSKLIKYNRLNKYEDPVPGRVLWLREKRPSFIAVEVKELNKTKNESYQKEKESDRKIIETKTTTIYSLEEENPENENNLATEYVKANTTYTEIKKEEIKKDPEVKSYTEAINNTSTKTTSDNTTYPATTVISTTTYQYINEVDTLKLKNSGATIHKVITGETLYQISKKYKTTVEAIQQWNHKKDYMIQIGERLIIYPNRKDF